MKVFKVFMPVVLVCCLVFSLGFTVFAADESPSLSIGTIDRTGWSATYVTTNVEALYADPQKFTGNFLRPIGVPEITGDKKDTVSAEMWIGNAVDSDYYQVDMKNTYKINEVDVSLLTNPGLIHIDISNDGVKYTRVVEDFDPAASPADSKGYFKLIFKETEARYVRFIIDANGAGFWLGMKDFKVIGYTDKLDRTGWSAKYTSTNTANTDAGANVMYADSNLFAGNIIRPLGVYEILTNADNGEKSIQSAMWIGNTIDGDFYEVDMKQTIKIDGVQVQLLTNPGLIHIDVSTDGENFVRALEDFDPSSVKADSLGFITLPFNSVDARYVRFIIDANGAGYWLGMGQMLVMSAPAASLETVKDTEANNETVTKETTLDNQETETVDNPKTGDNSMNTMIILLVLVIASASLMFASRKAIAK